MAIIQDYYNGACHIIVHDDYIIHDPVEIQKSIDKISKIVYQEAFRRHMEELETKKNGDGTA